MSKNKKICANCNLFNRSKNTCDVTLIIDGDYFELSVHPQDICIIESGGFANEIKSIPILNSTKDLNDVDA